MAETYNAPYTDPSLEPTPQKNTTTRTILIIIAVLLFLCCCCIITVWLFYAYIGDWLLEMIDYSGTGFWLASSLGL